MLSVPQRAVLRSTLRILVGALGMPRVRELARGSSLLGRDTRKASPEQLKKLISDSDHLARLITDALADSTRHQSALKTLHRLAVDLVKVPGLDPRVSHAFGKAHTALQQGDWQRLSRYTEELHQLKSQSDEAALTFPDVILALLAQDAQRLSAALDSEGQCSTERECIVPLGSVIGPAIGSISTAPQSESISAPTPPAQLPATLIGSESIQDSSSVADLALTIDGTGGATDSCAEAVPESPAPDRKAADSGPEPATEHEFEAPPPAGTGWKAWQTALEEGGRALSRTLDILSEPPQGWESLLDESGVLNTQAAALVSSFSAESYEHILTQTEQLARSASLLRDRVAQSLHQREQANAACRKVLTEHLGNQTSDNSFSLTPDSFRRVLLGLVEQGSALCQKVSELAQQPQLLDVLPSTEFFQHSPPANLSKLVADLSSSAQKLEVILADRIAAAEVEAALRAAEDETARKRALDYAAQEAPLDLPEPPSGEFAIPEPAAVVGMRVAFQRAGQLGTFPTTPAFAQKFATLPLAPDSLESSFLPFSLDQHRDGYRVVPPRDASPEVLVGSAARSLVAYWAAAAHRGDLLGFCLDLLKDARAIVDVVRDDSAAPIFEDLAIGLALFSCLTERTYARGRRRLARILEAGNEQDFRSGLLGIACEVAPSPALARALGDILAAGFEARLVKLVKEIQAESPAAARWFTESLATATAGLGRMASERLRRCTYEAFTVGKKTQDELEDFLEDSEKANRRGNRPKIPSVDADPLIIDLLQLLGDRLWERGRQGVGRPRINVSVPRLVERDGGLCIDDQARYIEVPLLVRNRGDAAAAGVSVVLQKPVRVPSPITGDAVEAHIPWLSDVKLEASSAAVVACKVEVDPEQVHQLKKLVFNIQSAWLGGKDSELLEIPISIGSTRVFDSKTVIGADGKPMDLNDERTFELSSSSVQRCFQRLRDRLRAGESVRAVIYGRRRRGKSSIIRSLEQDPLINQQYLLQHIIWNGPRITRLSAAMLELATCVRKVLLQSGAEVAALDLSDLSSAEEVSSRFLYWVETASRQVSQPVRVLLLIDEFQKWVAGLSSPQERQVLLNALRHFNEGALGNVDVSFVLCGLQNLREMMRASADFANAVDTFEVRELTTEEADRYVRTRLQEELWIELDDRTRKRLIRLSGGNPYVLNRLGLGLLQRLREKSRRWCTVADIDDLIESPDESRLDHYLQYMLREDEDENAATLRQLSVLRAVASLLSHRGDFAGYVRANEVEGWLANQNVRYEPSQPVGQLQELVHLGILTSQDNQRFCLPGEWLCRQLAALPVDRVPLQDVAARTHVDLVLNRYRKKQRLDYGLQAEIWKAENVEEGGNDVALKIYKGGTLGVDRLVETERRLLGRINHRNVVSCLGGSIDPRHGGVVVLQWIDGQPLSDLLRERPQAASAILPGPQRIQSQQVEFFSKLADAVRACHAADVAHKDLSPRNVMMLLQAGVWEPMIVDFGVAGCDSTEMDEGTVTLATPGYLAPEKAKGRRRTRASDMYSLGILFWQMQTGFDPTQGTFSADQVRRQLEEARVSGRLIQLILQMTAEQPSDRPTADDVCAALKTVLVPETAWEFYDMAQQAFIEQQLADAVELVEKALASIPASERNGSKYQTLLRDAVEIALESGAQNETCARILIGRCLEYGARPDAEQLAWDKMVDALSLWSANKSDREFPPLLTLLRGLIERPPTTGLMFAVKQLAEQARKGGILTEHRESIFELLTGYITARLIEPGIVEVLCVTAAESARVQRQDYLAAELWLKRARALGLTPSEEYQKEERRLSDVRQRTRRQQTLPTSCQRQDGLKVGDNEKGHLNLDRLRAFAERICRLYPFICRLRRVEKDPRLQISRPTLLRLDQVSSHLPQGTKNPGCVIPIALDSSYSGDVALRMNIELEPDSTEPQREAALEMLKSNTELFASNDTRR